MFKKLWGYIGTAALVFAMLFVWWFQFRVWRVAHPGAPAWSYLFVD
jgi:hypothetical protein